MVSAGLFVLAHGNDPRALPPAELFGNWALAIVTLLLAGGLARLALTPVLREATPEQRSEIAAWTAIALGVLVAMATWITRQSLVEGISPPPPPREHGHAEYHGGQMAMWGEYHAEVARAESGEYRVWLSDVYRRPISAQFFEVTLYPRDPQSDVVDLSRPFPLDLSLDQAYRFGIVDRDIKAVQIRLRYPGNWIHLDFEFDSPKGKKSLKDWCGT